MALSVREKMLKQSPKTSMLFRLGCCAWSDLFWVFMDQITYLKWNELSLFCLKFGWNFPWTKLCILNNISSTIWAFLFYFKVKLNTLAMGPIKLEMKFRYFCNSNCCSYIIVFLRLQNNTATVLYCTITFESPCIFWPHWLSDLSLTGIEYFKRNLSLLCLQTSTNVDRPIK